MKLFHSFDEEVRATVKELLTRKWKVDKVEKNKRGIVESVRIRAKCFGVNYYMWIDVYSIAGGRTWDWNQCIFYETNLFDCIYRELQHNEEFCGIVDSLVTEYV